MPFLVMFNEILIHYCANPKLAKNSLLGELYLVKNRSAEKNSLNRESSLLSGSLNREPTVSQIKHHVHCTL